MHLDGQVLDAIGKSDDEMMISFENGGQKPLSSLVDRATLLLAAMPSEISQILLRKKVLELLHTSIDRKLGHVWRGPFSFNPTRHQPLRCALVALLLVVSRA